MPSFNLDFKALSLSHTLTRVAKKIMLACTQTLQGVHNERIPKFILAATLMRNFK